MSRMPILETIIKYPTLITNAATNAPVVYALNEQSISDRVLFDVQTAADIYWQGEQDDYGYGDFGPLRLPYPSMWMEWEVPDDIVVNGKAQDGNQLAHTRCAVHLCEQQLLMTYEDSLHRDGPAPQNRPGTFDVMTYMQGPDGKVRVWPIAERISANSDGKFLQRMLVNPSLHSAEDAYIMDKSIGMLNLPALMALGLINCRNVKTQETGLIKLRHTKKQKRSGQPAWSVKYHTIVLPGEGSVQQGSGNSLTHRTSSIHRVRGHFKTFTAEKPLLGQHVGTYWWGWQVRGKAENGIVVSDYKVGVK